MQEQLARVQDLTQQLEDKNETIAAQQKQVAACMAALRGGGALALPPAPAADGSPGAPSRTAAARRGGEGGGEDSAVVLELKRSFKADAAEMKADFEEHIARLREARAAPLHVVHIVFIPVRGFHRFLSMHVPSVQGPDARGALQESLRHLAEAHAAKTEAATTAATLAAATERAAALSGDVERAGADAARERERTLAATTQLLDAHKALAAESDKLAAAAARAERLEGRAAALAAQVEAVTGGRREAEARASEAERAKHIAHADVHAAREQRRIAEDRRGPHPRPCGAVLLRGGAPQWHARGRCCVHQRAFSHTTRLARGGALTRAACRSAELVARLEAQVTEGGERCAGLARDLAEARARSEQLEALLHEQAHSDRVHRLEAAAAAAAAKVDALESDLAQVPLPPHLLASRPPSPQAVPAGAAAAALFCVRARGGAAHMTLRNLSRVWCRRAPRRAARRAWRSRCTASSRSCATKCSSCGSAPRPSLPTPPTPTPLRRPRAAASAARSWRWWTRARRPRRRARRCSTCRRRW